MTKRLTTEIFIEKANHIHENKFVYSKTIYTKASELVVIICPTHGEFERTANNHLRGRGCKECRDSKFRKELSKFIEEANFIHHGEYDYSKVEYINNSTNVIIICPLHGEFSQTANNHLSGSGCTFCRPIKIGNAFRSSTDEFICKANKIHNQKYDYSLVEYKSSHDKIKIICHVHGAFERKPNGHLLGKGCQKCANENHRLTTATFIERANIIHQSKYDYSLTNYTHSNKCVTIICPIHKEFEQLAMSHLGGSGCSKCFAQSCRLTQDEFITRSSAVHNNKYDYSKVNYVNQNIKVIIICPIHGEFTQNTNNHLRGSDCPECSNNVSKIETQWLDELNIPKDMRQITIKINGRNFRVDAYNPMTNTIYEFYGDMWHGNPEKHNLNDYNPVSGANYNDLYLATIEKERVIKAAGYNLVVMWENNYKNTKHTKQFK